jgi:hypothetical protein
VLLFGFGLSVDAYAQDQKASSKVTDRQGEAMSSVTMTDKGTTRGLVFKTQDISKKISPKTTDK